MGELEWWGGRVAEPDQQVSPEFAIDERVGFLQNPVMGKRRPIEASSAISGREEGGGGEG